MAAPAGARAFELELLMPLYPIVLHDHSDEKGVTQWAASLVRSDEHEDANNTGVRLVLHATNAPAAIVPVSCGHVNSGHTCTTTSCQLVELLLGLVALIEDDVLRVDATYVVTTVASPTATASASADAVASYVATLELAITLHEHAGEADAKTLRFARFALSHLIRERYRRSDHGSRLERVERARRSTCHVLDCGAHDIDDLVRPGPFQLEAIYETLMLSDVEAGQRPSTATRKAKRARTVSGLPSLPRLLLLKVVRMLHARDVAIMSQVCALCRDVTYGIVPGLKLTLFPHQKRALHWLMHRESSSRGRDAIPHPFLFPAVAGCNASGANSYAIDPIDRRVVDRRDLPTPTGVRGGLFCDEPGTGKTITMISLMLRTKGQRTNPRKLRFEEQAAPTSAVKLRYLGGGRHHETRLEASAATLVVVPGSLLQQWESEIQSKVRRTMLTMFRDDVDCTRDLPTPSELARYDVVITSLERLTQQWKYHKPASTQPTIARFGYEDAPIRFGDGHEYRGISSLLQVHWVRVVVDEGHKLGGRQVPHPMSFAKLLHADSRWIMTGTPTPNRFESPNLGYIHGLLSFLREETYGQSDRKAWAKAIEKPFMKNDRAGYLHLLHLLQRIMIRHTKASILKMRPTHRVVLVDPTPVEFAAYNGVVTAARLNLVTNRKKVTAHNDSTIGATSLLHASQRKQALLTVRDLRHATWGGGSVKVLLDDKKITRTIRYLEALGVDPVQMVEVTTYLQAAVGSDVVAVCPMCRRCVYALMVLPCGHLACADCVDARSARADTTCGTCHAVYDWEAMRRLQPGFAVTFLEDDWEYEHRPDTDASGGTSARPVKSQRADDKKKKKKKGKSKSTPQDYTRYPAVRSSKIYYVTRRIMELRKEFDAAWSKREGLTSTSPRPRLLKAIVFSQDRETAARVRVALIQHGIWPANYFDGTRAVRAVALEKFRSSPKTDVLVMSGAGSHGLDLSFVTHMFLMEEIFDKSLENQVVARAYRLGAQHSVVVEKLVVPGSLDEVFNDLQSSESGQNEGLVAQNILRNVQLMPDTHRAAFGFLRFKVLDEHGALVHHDCVSLYNPGKPPPTPTILHPANLYTPAYDGAHQPNGERVLEDDREREVSRVTSPEAQANTTSAESEEKSEPRVVPETTITSAGSDVSMEPMVVPETKITSADSDVSMESTAVPETKIKAEERAPLETSSSVQQSGRVQHTAYPMVIDLISDDDESDDPMEATEDDAAVETVKTEEREEAAQSQRVRESEAVATALALQLEEREREVAALRRALAQAQHEVMAVATAAVAASASSTLGEVSRRHDVNDVAVKTEQSAIATDVGGVDDNAIKTEQSTITNDGDGVQVRESDANDAVDDSETEDEWGDEAMDDAGDTDSTDGHHGDTGVRDIDTSEPHNDMTSVKREAVETPSIVDHSMPLVATTAAARTPPTVDAHGRVQIKQEAETIRAPRRRRLTGTVIDLTSDTDMDADSNDDSGSSAPNDHDAVKREASTCNEEHA